MKPLASLSLLTAISLSTFAPGLPAQDTIVTPAAGAPVVVSLSFDGGTLAEFVAQIRARESRANIIVAEAAKDIRLPPIELRNAGLESVLEAACSVGEGTREPRVVQFDAGGEPVYSVLATPREGATSEAEERERRATQVHSLNHLTGSSGSDAGKGIGFASAVILSSLETAMEGTGTAPTIRYHKESGLLIFRGNEEQREIAEAVIRALQEEVERRAAEHARRQESGESADAQEKSPK